MIEKIFYVLTYLLRERYAIFVFPLPVAQVSVLPDFLCAGLFVHC